MNWKRVGRLLVCLVLVAALIVNVSPIRAKAIGPTSALVSVGIVIASVLIGLGISVGTKAQANVFDDVVSDAKKFLTLDYNFITDDDKVQIWSTGNPDMPWAVDESLIDALFGWLYDSGTISSLPDFISKYPNISEDVLSYAQSFPYYAVFTNRWGDTQILCNSAGFNIVKDVMFSEDNSQYKVSKYHIVALGSGESLDTATYSKWNNLSSGGYGDLLEPGWYVSDPDTLVSFDIVDTAAGTVTTALDLTLGEVAPMGTPIPDGYSVWNSNAMLVQDDDGSSKYIYPVSLGDTYESTREFGQTDVWEGIGSTYSDNSTDTDTGTDTGTSSGTAADVVTGVVSGLQDQTAQLGVWLGELIAGVQAIPQAIADVLTAIFVPSADYVTAKVESLRARFPFISSVISTGESLRDSISGSSGPPAIYVDLGRASSGNYGSQKVLLTDFAWYAEYKPTVDAVLSAALWAFFGWRVFLKLPGIISGESGVVGDISARAETYNKIKAGPPTKK